MAMPAEKIKLSKPGDRWRLPMIWQATDHSKMKPIKDPRVDGEGEAIDTDTTEMKQSKLDIANSGDEPD